MPDDIEDVFAGLGLTLLPATARELSLDCSCPDGAVPCKHLAATFYLLAESFDDDPFAHPRLARTRAWGSAGECAGCPVEGAAPRCRPYRADGTAGHHCLDSYFIRQADITSPSPRVTSSTALLDQLPDVTVGVRGRSLVEILRPADAALGEGDR
jgi:uncharacterized Zn finger protein